ncbi:MAG: FHA domain-containing protein [Anaerolineales bacterium]|nr:FHA domain-containing protein [Anaerolineales bacterium]
MLGQAIARWATALCLLGLLLQPAWARAQARQPSAVITAVDAGNFPEIQVYLAVTDASGRHIPGLPASAFALIENQSPLPNLSLLEADLGVQIVFVLDANAAFRTRDVAGVNRLGYILQALNEFVRQEMQAEADDVSIVTSEQTLIAHGRSRDPVIDALNRYTTDFAGAADPGALISTGLNLASDVTPRPGMRRMLVVLANGLPPATPVADLVARAQATGVVIHTVYVGPADALATVSAQTLGRLSQATGGLSLVLENARSLQPIFEAVANARPQYRLSYRSTVKTTGRHTLAATVQLPDGTTLTTPEVSFQLRVEPPLVMDPGLPAQIMLGESESLAVPIVVTFPDGHRRALREVQLLVDGNVAATQSGDATTVDWPLAAYTESVTPTVQLRVTDELGLRAESKPQTVALIAAPVAASADARMPAQTSAPGLLTLILPIAALALLLMALGSIGVFIWLRRQQVEQQRALIGGETIPGRPLASDPRPASPREPATRSDDSTLPRSPTPAKKVPTLQHPAAPRLTRAGRSAPPGLAYLEILDGGEGDAPRETIELYGQTVKLGRDPAVVNILFTDRSVSRLHARIEQTRPGIFCLYDEGSTSGTWVNFTLISLTEGYELKSGDLINLGRVQLRFRRREGVSPDPKKAGRLSKESSPPHSSKPGRTS